MSAHPELPLDVWERITAILGEELHPDLRKNSDSLKALSLTCTALISLCQKHLFATLLLNTDSARSARFKSVVSEKPELVPYIRVLQYRIDCDEYGNVDLSNIDGHGVLEILLDQSTILRSVSLSTTTPYSHRFASTNWDALPSLWQTLFKKILHLTSVTELTLAGLNHLPTHIFAGCGNITHLAFGEVDFIEKSNDLEDQSSDISPHLISFDVIYSCSHAIKFLLQSRNHNNQRTINFSSLKRISMPYVSPDDQQAVWDLLPIASGLESIALDSTFLPAFPRLGTTLAAHTISTLKQISIHLTIYWEDYASDPLCGLVSELTVIAGLNIVEEISLVVEFETDVGCTPDTEDWTAFDSLLTTSGSFPKLKSVSVSIRWNNTIRETNEIDILKRITNQKFPALLASETVDFRLLGKKQGSSTRTRIRTRGN